jgi:alpha-1,6-mannosyltransferase
MAAIDQAAAAERQPGLPLVERQEALRTMGLVALGVAASVICLLLTLQMSFLEFFPGTYGTSIFAPQFIPDWQKAVAIFSTAYLAAFVVFALVMLVLSRRHGGRTEALVLAIFPVIFVVILSFMYPPFSLDFVHNVADARTLWRFGDNPIVVPPHENPFPVLQFWGHLTAPYGPLWFVLLFPIVFAGESVQAGLHIIKFYTGLYYLGSAVLIYLIARRITPGRELFAFALYAWNPFVFLRVVGNGHNDLVMFFFVLLSIWLVVNGHWRYALPVLVASALVKYVSLLLGPPIVLAAFLAAEDKQLFRRETAIAAGLSLLVVVTSFAYFWEGMDTFDGVRTQTELYANSPLQFVRDYLFFHGTDVERANDITRWGGAALFAVAYVVLLVAYWRSQRRFVDLLGTMSLILIAYCLLGATWYQPWYNLWPVTLLALVPGFWAVALLLALSVGGTFADLAMWYGPRLELLRGNQLRHLAVIITVSMGSAVAALVAGWWFTRRLIAVTPAPDYGIYAGGAVMPGSLDDKTVEGYPG